MQEDDFTLWEEELNEASGGANLARSYADMVSDMCAYLDPRELAEALDAVGCHESAEALRYGGSVMSLRLEELAAACYVLGVIPVTMFVGPDTEGGTELIACVVAAGRAARDERDHIR